ncbi:MAG: type I methionyl aminopeptidase [Anaerolineales bacterium]|nr:MAG: type I methionyl aminopeptidase [Anaerolineales bacterium]
MRQAGRIVAEVLATMREMGRPGVSTAELDAVAEDIITRQQAIPAFKGYPHNGQNDFPASICASINEEIVHGIPSPHRILKDGDIISIDVGAIYEGFHGDAAITLLIGKTDKETQRLLEATEGALMAGIAQAREHNHLWNVIRAIQSHAERSGFNVLREYQGHGIGRHMHEKPDVPNFLGPRGRRPKNYPLESGMTIALEPMVVAGDWRTRVLDDGWTVVTADGNRSAHFEHTIAITNGEPEILTRL